MIYNLKHWTIDKTDVWKSAVSEYDSLDAVRDAIESWLDNPPEGVLDQTFWLMPEDGSELWVGLVEIFPRLYPAPYTTEGWRTTDVEIADPPVYVFDEEAEE